GRVGERECLLLGQRVLLRRGVVADVSTSRLTTQPLGHVPGVQSGSLSQLAGSSRVTSQRLVKAELVAHHHAGCGHRCPEIADEPAEKIVEFVLVESHFPPSILERPGGPTVVDGLATRLQHGCNGCAENAVRHSDRGAPCEPGRPMNKATLIVTV